MMQTIATDSLLDEADFVAELATLEDGMTMKPREYALPSEVLAPVSTRPPGKFVDAQEPSARVEATDGDSSAMRQIAAAAMFVLMMAVGAAGAAAVFHERVARILATW
jgi:hypothetical protein